MTPRIAVLGAGSIGRRHAEALAACPTARLAGLADPSEAARALADRLGVPWHPDLAGLLADRPDGVIVATPSALHAAHAAECVAAGVPVLVEKPIATDLAAARGLVEAAERAGVALLVGHHRRHNPLVAAARAAVEAGRIGRVVTASALCWLMKPQAYFAPAWRREPGAGPVLTNLIHDVDLMRHLCGEVVAVQAMESSALRGHAVEDTAAAVLRFASGALGTMSVSDTAVAPWSWELTAAENPDYPETGQSCYQVAGTLGAIEIPALRLWRNPGPPGWHEPMEASPLPHAREDPLLRQVAHFAEVVAGEATPLVTGRDGLAALEVLDAIGTGGADRRHGGAEGGGGMSGGERAPDLRLGLIGDNIARSRAPLLHRLAGRQLGLRITYDRLIPRDLGRPFEAVFEGCARGGFRGINVTYPYKERAARMARAHDPAVAALGAVNTVVFGEDSPEGFNTDHSGFVASHRGVRGDAPPGVVCMIGTGGVGRAVAFGLVALGAEALRLADRDEAKARALATDLREAAPEIAVEVFGTAEAAAEGADGLVNCTPVGMVGHEGTPLPRERMAGASWAFDAVYTPVDTRFLRDAEAEGLTVISGYELFFHQGVHAAEIFTGRALDEARLRADLAAEGPT